MNRIAGTDQVEIFEEFRVIELFLKREGGARETGDEDDGRFCGVAGSVSPNFSTILGLHKLSEGWHDREGIQMLLGKWGRETEKNTWELRSQRGIL
jgi:hypothetical protein